MMLVSRAEVEFLNFFRWQGEDAKEAEDADGGENSLPMRRKLVFIEIFR
jgi:hypothetical protein